MKPPFLMIASAGFEAFFAQVSSLALADRVPTVAENAAVDAQLMAAAASGLGVTIPNQPERTDDSIVDDV